MRWAYHHQKLEDEIYEFDSDERAQGADPGGTN